MKVELEKVLESVAGIGGTDASDEYSKGWDSAVDAVYSEINKLAEAESRKPAHIVVEAWQCNELQNKEGLEMTKQELMKELLDRYQQLDSLEGCKSAKDTVVLYIRKLELKLKEML